MPADVSATLLRQRRIGPGLMLLFAFGGLLAVLLAVAAWTWLASARELAAELQRLRASGEPVSAEELEAFYELPPEGRDTTKIWLAALAPLVTSEFQIEVKDLPLVGERGEPAPLPGEAWQQLEEAEQVLGKYQRSLESMHRATRLGGRARFTTNFTSGDAMLLPHAQQLRAGARLLALEAAVHVHRGLPDAAVESVQAIFAAVRSLEQEPLLVSQLVRMALGSAACEQVVWLLSADMLDDDQLAALEAELTACDYQKPFRRALIGVRTIGLRLFTDPNELGAGHARFTLLPSADQAMFLKVMAALIAAAEKPGSARLDAVDDAELSLTAVAGTTSGRLRYPTTLLIMPSLRPSAESVSRHEAQRDVTRVAVAIERFRRRQGRLPANFPELVPQLLSALPDDPFSGRPLQYRTATAEYLVYSVGTNGVDDGGSDQPPERPADIIVRVPLHKTETKP